MSFKVIPSSRCLSTICLLSTSKLTPKCKQLPPKGKLLQNRDGNSLQLKNSNRKNLSSLKVAYDSYLKDPKYQPFISLMNNTETIRQIKLILMEHEYARLSELDVPNQISLLNMTQLLNCKSVYERHECFSKLREFEKQRNDLRLRDKLKASSTKWETNRQLMSSLFKSSSHICYGTENSLHENVNSLSFYAHRLAQATKFGQPLVFDFGYDKFMDSETCRINAIAVQRACEANHKHWEPFDIYFCNLENNYSKLSTITNLRKGLNYSFGKKSMITESGDNYFDVFRDKKCVYLSPHAEKSMEYFDHEAVYIIGAYMDPNIPPRPVTLARAKKDGVQCLNLPVEKYSKFRLGFQRTRNLPFVVIMQILLEIKTSGDWNKITPFLPMPKYYSRKGMLDHWNDDDDDTKSKPNRCLINEKTKFRMLLKDGW